MLLPSAPLALGIAFLSGVLAEAPLAPPFDGLKTASQLTLDAGLLAAVLVLWRDNKAERTKNEKREDALLVYLATRDGARALEFSALTEAVRGNTGAVAAMNDIWKRHLDSVLDTAVDKMKNSGRVQVSTAPPARH